MEKNGGGWFQDLKKPNEKKEKVTFHFFTLWISVFLILIILAKILLAKVHREFSEWGNFFFTAASLTHHQICNSVQWTFIGLLLCVRHYTAFQGAKRLGRDPSNNDTWQLGRALSILSIHKLVILLNHYWAPSMFYRVLYNKAHFSTLLVLKSSKGHFMCILKSKFMGSLWFRLHGLILIQF
jgi:hypothetical protein